MKTHLICAPQIRTSEIFKFKVSNNYLNLAFVELDIFEPENMNEWFKNQPVVCKQQ